MSTLTPQFGFAIHYPRDLEASRGFYEGVLGLKVQRVAPNFVQYDKFALAGDEPLSGKRELELYWLVDDAEAAYAELSKTAEIAAPLRELPFGKVFGVRDPDGEVRLVLQLAANRPSQAV
jgi:catechol 2,3-dioxygenase-like lactoylglutathione lyase family enzyme